MLVVAVGFPHIRKHRLHPSLQTDEATCVKPVELSSYVSFIYGMEVLPPGNFCDKIYEVVQKHSS